MLASLSMSYMNQGHSIILLIEILTNDKLHDLRALQCALTISIYGMDMYAA